MGAPGSCVVVRSLALTPCLPLQKIRTVELDGKVIKLQIVRSSGMVVQGLLCRICVIVLLPVQKAVRQHRLSCPGTVACV